MKIRYIFLFALMPVITGCAIQKAAQPMDPVGFIDRKTEGLVSEEMPFQYAWVADEDKDEELEEEIDEVIDEVTDDGSYEIYVAPVQIKYLPDEFLEEDTERERAKMLAEYFQSRLEKVFRRTEKGALKITPTEKKSESVLTLEIVFAEIKVGEPLFYSAALAAPFPGVASALDANDSPRMAIEGRLVHTDSGEVMAEFADRKIPKIRIIDVKKAVSKNYPLREIINDWCLEIVRAVQARNDRKMAYAESRFSLLPW